MGDVIVCDKVCLGVPSTASLFSCDNNQSLLVDEAPRERESKTIEFLFEDLTLGR